MTHRDDTNAKASKKVPMSGSINSKPKRGVVDRRRALAPQTEEAFRNFSRVVFASGAIDARTKQLIAVAVAHVTQCPWCIDGHVKAATRAGATAEQVMEAIWVAAEMRAGASWAHALKAVEVLDEQGSELN